MIIKDVPFCITDWNKKTTEEYKGEAGTSYWKTFELGNIRVRIVQYSPGYYADHWCSKGHILFVLEGELTCKLKNGSTYNLTSGMSFQASDDESNPHLAYTEKGAKVFLVD
ncbi:DHCW motif cupin fold protein [candidate division KSB1 bacterium]